jgi:hypothetical protein
VDEVHVEQRHHGGLGGREHDEHDPDDHPGDGHVGGTDLEHREDEQPEEDLEVAPLLAGDRLGSVDGHAALSFR